MIMFIGPMDSFSKRLILLVPVKIEAYASVLGVMPLLVLVLTYAFAPLTPAC